MDNLTKFCNEIDYNDPRNTNLEEIELDTNIKEFVININKSNWIYTLFSCQGHKEEKNSHTLPYFVFIVENNRINEFLQHIYNTTPTYKVTTYNLPEIASNNIFLSETNNNKILYPLAGKYEFKINPAYSNQHYTVISVYWDTNCIDNQEFYDKLKLMANDVISNKNNITLQW